MFKFYDVPMEASLAGKAFEAEAIYFCMDTGNFYVDSVNEQTRKQISYDTIILATESARTALLTPIPGKIYCILESGCMYIYLDNAWHQFGSRPRFTFVNVYVEAGGSITIDDARILASDKAVFIPDLTMADLCTASTATCANGSVTVSITSSYPITGTVYINN